MRIEASTRKGLKSQAGSISRSACIGLAFAAAVGVAVVLSRRQPDAAVPPPAVAAADTPQPPVESTLTPEVTDSPGTVAQPSAAITSAKPVLKTNAPATSPALQLLPRGEPTPEARQAVAALTQIDLSSGAITPTQAAVWKESLRALVGQGEAAVPAIREFLDKNLDLNFGSLENGSAMGASSLRMALLNAMQEIGGEQAIAGSLQALQTSADPTELALVASYLQKADPAQYRDSVLAAAHEALNMAATGQWDGRDVAPLFDVLKTFGGEEAARDLERYASTWFNYTPLVLAELPDGAGIASLIRLNSDGAVSIGKETYQRMLAQVSIQSTDAAAALVQLAQAGKIAPSSWRSLADALTGITLELSQSPVSRSATQPAATKSYHIAIGNQNYLERPPSANMGIEEVTQRINLIDQVLGVTSDPSAISSLQDARSKLAARL